MPTFLNLNGEIEDLTYKDIKARTGKFISWEKMHDLNKHKCDSLSNKYAYDVVKKYLGEVSVFDFNNMVEFGYLQLYPYYIELALKNGAIDRRKEE